jgi:hypothetical protein
MFGGSLLAISTSSGEMENTVTQNPALDQMAISISKRDEHKPPKNMFLKPPHLTTQTPALDHINPRT